MYLAKMLQVNCKIWWYSLKIKFPFPGTSCSLMPDSRLCSYSRCHHSSKLFLEHFQHYRARYRGIAVGQEEILEVSHIYFQLRKKNRCHAHVSFYTEKWAGSCLIRCDPSLTGTWAFHFRPNLYIFNSECRNIKFKFICEGMSKKTGENIFAKEVRRWWQWLWVCCSYIWQITEQY